MPRSWVLPLGRRGRSASPPASPDITESHTGTLADDTHGGHRTCTRDRWDPSGGRSTSPFATFILANRERGQGHRRDPGIPESPRTAALQARAATHDGPEQSSAMCSSRASEAGERWNRIARVVALLFHPARRERPSRRADRPARSSFPTVGRERRDQVQAGPRLPPPARHPRSVACDARSAGRRAGVFRSRCCVCHDRHRAQRSARRGILRYRGDVTRGLA